MIPTTGFIKGVSLFTVVTVKHYFPAVCLACFRQGDTRAE